MAGMASASILDWATARERRIKPRKAVLELSLITVHLGNGGFGVMLDASEDGLGVQVMGGAPPGTELKLAFEVPHVARPVEGVGLVNWYDGRGRIGMKLRELKPNSQEAFRTWVTSLPEPNTPETRVHDGSGSLVEQAHTIQAQIASHELDFGLVLQHLIERTIQMTGASGGAVAIESGGDMVCRASAGLAPEVGVSIDSKSALTSECIRTASPVLYDDTEADPRVNRDICRQLSLRSLLIVPIVLGEQVKGVLEIFSSDPCRFSHEHQLLLEQLARFIAEVIAPPDAGAFEPTAPAKAETARQAAFEAFPAIPEKRLEESTASLPVVAPIESPDAPVFADAVAQPEAVSPIEESRSEIDSLLEQYEEEPGRDPRILPLIALALVLLVVGAVWLYARMSKSGAEVQPATVQAAPAKVVESSATSPAPQQEIPMPIDSLPIRGGEKTTSELASSTEHTTAKPAPAKPNDLPQDVVRDVPAARQLPSAGPRQSSNEAPFEALTATGIGGAAQLGSVAFPSVVTTPKLSSRGISGGMLLHRVEPEYPLMARKLRLAGDVELAAKITKTGTVENVRRVKGSSVLAVSAVNAVKQWRYEPYTVNGEAQEVEVSIVLHFRMPN